MAAGSVVSSICSIRKEEGISWVSELFRMQQILNIDTSFPLKAGGRAVNFPDSPTPSFQRSEAQRSCCFPARSSIGVLQEKCHRFVFSQLKNGKCFVNISEIPQAAALELLRAKTQPGGFLAFLRLRMFLAPH